jgi:hypothetical protein
MDDADVGNKYNSKAKPVKMQNRGGRGGVKVRKWRRWVEKVTTSSTFIVTTEVSEASANHIFTIIMR